MTNVPAPAFALRKFAGRQARELRYQLGILDALRFTGSRFGCPVCGWRFRALKPLSGVCSIRGETTDLATRNADCPRCRSGIRQRFAFAFLKARTRIETDRLRVIHFAPDPGIYKALSGLPNLDYVAADLNPVRFVRAAKLDITDIALPSDSVDGIICIHVLEHIDDDRRAIGELHRIARRGSWALIAIPTYGAETFEDRSLDYAGRERMYGTGDHLRLNGLDFARKLEAAGFTVEVVAIEDFGGDFVDRSEHTPHTESDRYLFFCTKP